MKDWIVDLYKTPKMFIVDLLKWGIVTFLIGVELYILYELLIKWGAKIKRIFLIKD